MTDDVPPETEETMTDQVAPQIEILFLFEKPQNALDQRHFDTWLKTSPWGRRPGTWSLWSLSFGNIPDSFMKAKAVVAVGAGATRWMMEHAELPKRVKSTRLVNRTFKVTPIEGFGQVRFLLVLYSGSQIELSQKWTADQKSTQALWTLFAYVKAPPTVDT